MGQQTKINRAVRKMQNSKSVKLQRLKSFAEKLPEQSLLRNLILAEPDEIDALEYVGKVGTWLKILEMEIANEAVNNKQTSGFPLRPRDRDCPGLRVRHGEGRRPPDMGREAKRDRRRVDAERWGSVLGRGRHQKRRATTKRAVSKGGSR